jgi:hypothetical protein
MAPRPRSDLQELLDSLVPEGKRAYFQEPGNLQMSYPCILYKRSDVQFEHADNSPYAKRNRWTITVIDPDPESTILAKVEALPTVSFDRHYVAENLNHDVYTIFF